MEIARDAMGLPPGRYRLDADLKELSFGDWEGMTWPEIEARDPKGVKARNSDKWIFAPPGGESYATLAARLRPWLDGLTADAFVVAHGGVGAGPDGAHRRRGAGEGGRGADRPRPRAVLREWGLSLDRLKAPRLPPVPSRAVFIVSAAMMVALAPRGLRRLLVDARGRELAEQLVRLDLFLQRLVEELCSVVEVRAAAPSS